MRKTTVLVMLLLLMPVAADTALGRVIYVDVDATGTSSGTSWADAYRSLQDALAVAFNGDEIRVAQGAYKPDRGAGNWPGDREATFRPVNGVALKGGYAGYGEPNPDARDINLYKTILSGDLKGNDTGDLDDPSRNENSYRVVSAQDVFNKTTIEGFTITGGNANSSTPQINYGAGMICLNAGLRVTDCVFRANRATERGGGVWSGAGVLTFTRCTFEENWSGQDGGGIWFHGTDPTLIDCVFTSNRSVSGGGIGSTGGSLVLTNCTFNGNVTKDAGGGIAAEHGNLTLTSCTFGQNSADGNGGGGISKYSSNLLLTKCRFDNNQAPGHGGGILDMGGSVQMTGCIFTENMAGHGGAVLSGYGGDPSTVTALNCAFIRNSATAATNDLQIRAGSAAVTNCTFVSTGAISHRGAVTGDTTNLIVTNSILWGNAAGELPDGAKMVTYSNVQGGRGKPWFGAGCIDRDPLFADPNGRLTLNSPCVDAGSNAAVPAGVLTDLDGNRRIQRAVVDMGAYEVVASPEELLNLMITQIQRLAAADFANADARGALVTITEAVLTEARAGLYQNALDDLRDELLPRADGCSKTGAPDGTDWLITCGAQEKIHPLIVEAIEAVEPLAIPIYMLTVSATPGGSVIKPGEGAFLYKDGESVPIEAVASDGYIFKNWSGTAVDAGKVSTPTASSAAVVMDADYTLIANFAVASKTEDFEGGTLPEGWSSEYPSWHVASADAHSGKYSVRTGYIDDNQTTSLTLRATVGEGQITFWRKVSTEPWCDVYRFLIDGMEMEALSGEHAWKEVSFPITAGEHTFVWEYTKDASSGLGRDTAYIDDVCIPLSP